MLKKLVRFGRRQARLRLPAPVWRAMRNRYLLVFVAAMVWMAFFDQFDVRSQLKLRSQIQKLEADKAYFQSEIDHTRARIEELRGNPDALEKLAREKYLMKRPDEDVYVLVAPDKGAGK